MAANLKNKVVVVTGGAAGIGCKIADSFLENEVKLIIIVDLDEKHGKEAIKTLNTKHGNDKSVFIKCDVTKDLEPVFKKIIDIYKQVDALVNSAGILNGLSPRKTIDVNLTALIEWSLTFLDHMRRDKGGNGGTIINMASIFGFRVVPYTPVYSASKFAVMGFTRSIGHEYNYKKTGVRVIAIAPGFTETANTSLSKFIANEQLEENCVEFLKAQDWQKSEAVGQAAVEIFEKAESGTAWLIEGSRPIVEVK